MYVFPPPVEKTPSPSNSTSDFSEDDLFQYLSGAFEPLSPALYSAIPLYQKSGTGHEEFSINTNPAYLNQGSFSLQSSSSPKSPEMMSPMTFSSDPNTYVQYMKPDLSFDEQLSRFKCACGKTFVRKPDLQRHLRNVHSQCWKCGRTWTGATCSVKDLSRVIVEHTRSCYVDQY